MNKYNQKAIQFLKAIKKLVKDKQRDNCDILFKTLDCISLKEDFHLGLKVAVHEGMGDESAFYTYKGDKDPYGKEEMPFIRMNEELSILSDLNVEKSEMGAWQVYLLYMSPTVLPVYWHGGYIVREYFFDIPDEGKTVIEPFHAVTPLMIPIEEIPKPTVTAEDDKFIVSCTYWNDWEGLVQETIRIKFQKNGSIRVLKPSRRIIRPYDCGILF